MASTMRKHGFIYFSLGGLVGPILFTVVTVTCSRLRTNYNHINQFISELAATKTSNADLMKYAGFIPSGLIVAAFGVSLLLFMPTSLLGRIGAVLISLFGAGMVVAGFYPCDMGCPLEGGSFANVVHNEVSGPAFVSVILGIFLLSFSFRRFSYWKKLWVYSLISAVVAVIFMVLLINSLESTGRGLWQRLLLTTVFLWLGVTAVKLFSFVRNSSAR